jgi:hypothetical protein
MGLFNAVEEAANQVRDGAEQAVSDAGDLFNQYTDTIEDASEFGEQLVSDGGEPVNYNDGPEDVDTSSQDFNLGDPGNKWLDGIKKPEEPPRFTTFPEPTPKRPANPGIDDAAPGIFDVAPGINVDTSSQDNDSDEGPVDVDTLFPPFDNDSDEGPVDVDTLFPPFDNDSDGRPDNRKEEPPKPSEPDNRKEEPPKPSEPAEAANKYKGIIQLGFVAVVIAGTVGAFVWGKN